MLESAIRSLSVSLENSEDLPETGKKRKREKEKKEKRKKAINKIIINKNKNKNKKTNPEMFRIITSSSIGLSWHFP